MVVFFRSLDKFWNNLMTYTWVTLALHLITNSIWKFSISLNNDPKIKK